MMIFFYQILLFTRHCIPRSMMNDYDDPASRGFVTDAIETYPIGISNPQRKGR